MADAKIKKYTMAEETPEIRRRRRAYVRDLDRRVKGMTEHDKALADAAAAAVKAADDNQEEKRQAAFHLVWKALNQDYATQNLITHIDKEDVEAVIQNLVEDQHLYLAVLGAMSSRYTDKLAAEAAASADNPQHLDTPEAATPADDPFMDGDDPFMDCDGPFRDGDDPEA